ncbi:MAG: UvrD-helicase domain-containing protein [Nitrospiraceae bacterium]
MERDIKPYVLRRGEEDRHAPRLSLDYEGALNPQQLAAVTAGDGPALVIAGAGSGKTRTLVYRVAYLIDRGIDPQTILLVTFTRKAAQEMLNRAGLLIGARCDRVTGGTFHSVANTLLRRYGRPIGVEPGFTILDRGDAEDLINLLRGQLGLSEKEKRFPRKGTIAEIFSKCENTLQSLEEVVLGEFAHFSDHLQDFDRLKRAYEGAKRQRQLLDYDDLLVKLRGLLDADERTRRTISSQFRFLLVDEYQDTNRLQADLIRKLAATHENVMVVGDDSQCVLEGTPILTPQGYRPVESLRVGDAVLSGGGNGRLVESFIAGKTKNVHHRYLRVKTRTGHEVCFSPNHLCFARLRSGSGLWYVYLMHRMDFGYRIGVTRLPRSDAEGRRPQMRTAPEQGERLWLLETHQTRQEAQYREALLGLRYQIPQALFCPESRRSATFKMSDAQAAALFTEFGKNGARLLKDYGLVYDYPTYLPKSSKSRGRIAINLLMASASNRVEKRQHQGHELAVESQHGWEAVEGLQGLCRQDGYWRLRRFSRDYKSLLSLAKEIESRLRRRGYQATIAYKAKFVAASGIHGSFMTIPAAGLLPGMVVPVVKEASVTTDIVETVEWVENSESRPFYDLEIENSHNIVSAGIISHNSIYGFRGATFRNIMGFPELFPGAKIYKLEENYRSTQPILNLANAVIQGAAEKYTKHLFTRKLDGPLPVLVQAGGEHTQSRFVAQKILELREEGVALGEMAVLFRSSFHAFDLEIELSRKNLPFVKRGGYKFIETAHVKDLLAHLRVVENPLDAVSWNRLLLLAEGVGPKKAQELIASFMKSGRPGDVLREVGGRCGRALKDLARILEEVGREGAMTPAEQVNRVYEYYLPVLREQYDDYPKRMRDLEHLSSMAERYRRLDQFLADLALEPPDESLVDVEAPNRDDERLVLSTIHSAKGLEWRCVFVIWVVDGRFPSAYSFMTEDELEEERRLLYVAVTRAKDHLYLTYPINIYDKTTGMVLSKPSRFLDEVPAACFDTWTLVEDDESHAWD